MISGWEGSYCDLRQRRPKTVYKAKTEVPVSDEVAASLRGLWLLDSHCERLVFAARTGPPGRGAVLDADSEDLDELVGFVAAEANHETDRRRHKRLDEAFAALSDALAVMGG